MTPEKRVGVSENCRPTTYIRTEQACPQNKFQLIVVTDFSLPASRNPQGGGWPRQPRKVPWSSLTERTVEK
jgi:hypothetical protein